MVSSNDESNNMDAMMKNQDKTTRTRWIFESSRMAESIKSDRTKGTMIPRLLQYKVCKDNLTGKERWKRMTVISTKPMKRPDMNKPPQSKQYTCRSDIGELQKWLLCRKWNWSESERQSPQACEKTALKIIEI